MQTDVPSAVPSHLPREKRVIDLGNGDWRPLGSGATRSALPTAPCCTSPLETLCTDRGGDRALTAISMSFATSVGREMAARSEGS